MTDVRARIAEALRKHVGKRHVGSGTVMCADGPRGSDLNHGNFPNWEAWSNHLTDVLLALDGIKFVALPEQSWPNDFGTSFDCEVMATETGRVLSNLDDYSPDYARALAAALLAAAEAAEQAAK